MCFNEKSEFKTDEYGPEVKKLLQNKGFKVNCKTADEKEALFNDVMKYLKSNQDSDFNIRLGILLFRNNLIRAKGNLVKAANDYNTVDKTDGKKILSIYNRLCKAEKEYDKSIQ